jgi:hypothetical protein
MAGLGVVFGIETLQSRTDFDTAPTSATRDAFYKNRTIADVGIVGAGAGAAIGAVIWLTAPSPTAGGSRTSIGVAPNGGGATLTTAVRF